MGIPSYTKDLDVWIGPGAENASRLIEALDQFGFGSLGLKANDFLQPEQIVQLGYPPNRIDMLVTLTGVEFNECYASRVPVDIVGVLVNFMNLENPQ